MLPRAVQQADSRQSFDPAGAGAVLVGALGACTGAGALIGWGSGSMPLGALAGAVVGIPAGVALVYRRYRDAFR